MDIGQFGGRKRQEMAMDSCTSIRVGRVEIFQEFRWISLTGLFVSFDWMKLTWVCVVLRGFVWFMRA